MIGAAAVSVMVTVLLGALAIYQTATASGAKLARRRLDSLMGTSMIEQVSTGTALREERLSALPAFGSLLSGKEWADRAAVDLDRADLHLRVGEYLALRLVLALLFATGAALLLHGQVGVLLGLALAVVGFEVPAFWLSRRKKGRVAKLESQLEEALTLVSSALKGGFGLLQSLEQAADQLTHPISTELHRTIHDIGVGSSTEQALLGLSERAGSYDLDIVVSAIMIQRTVGGNLAEILDTVAHTMRERARVRGEIKALTSQQMLTGYVLGGLPFVVGGILFLASRDYMLPLFTTVAGQAMLAGAAVMEAIGVLIIKRILTIEV